MASSYYIDANVLIEAAKTYYAFDRVPGFWLWLQHEMSAGTIRTASLVVAEIDFPEALVQWLSDRNPAEAFVDVSATAIQAKFRGIAAWTVTAPFGPEHIAKFLDGADPWLIAAAAVHGACVVTQETHVGPGSRRVKIPNVCDEFDVRCVNTFEMLDELGAQF